MMFFTPRISADTAAFWDGCKEHKLIFQRCLNCGKLIWPASYVCPVCLCSDKELIDVEPKGRLYSFVVMHKAFHPSLEDKVPYVVGAVDLDAGVRISVNIQNCEAVEMHCGDRVKIEFEDDETYSKPIARMEGRR